MKANCAIIMVGHTPYKGVIIILDQRKTNQFGKNELGACIRNKEVENCPVGAIGLHLFYRYHIAKEFPPDFSKSEL